MRKRLLLFALLAAASNCYVYAQSWQWGKIGGGTQDGAVNRREEVTAMATDKNGNVYAATIINYAPVLAVDGHAITLPTGAAPTLVFSYTCDGTFRWGKVMNITEISNIGVDTLGGVYIAGQIFHSDFYMGSLSTHDADTSWTYNKKVLALVKLDTLGNKQWMRLPEPDTLPTISTMEASLDMQVEENGTVHWLCVLNPGAYSAGFVAASQGNHIIRYDRHGNYTGNTRLSYSYPTYSYIPSGIFATRFCLSKKNNRYILCGGSQPFDPTLTIGTTTVTAPLYLASFDQATGNALWVKTGSSNTQSRPRPATDTAGNIYFAALAGHGETFNGFTLLNTYTTIPHNVPFLQKLAADGTPIWTHGTSATIQTHPGAVLVSDTTVAITGSYGSEFKWDNGTEEFYSDFTTTAVNVFLTRFRNTTGNYIGTDTLAGTINGFEYTFAMVPGLNGSYYVGGRTDSDIVVAGTTLNKAGGANDFFVAKFGSNNCSTTITPPPPTGLETAPMQNTIAIYPNPANDRLTVFSALHPADLVIYEISGRKVAATRCYNERCDVDVSALVPGLYIAEIKDTNGTRAYQRFVKSSQ